MALAQPKGLWPPCQHNLFITSGPPSLAAFLSFTPPPPTPCPPVSGRPLPPLPLAAAAISNPRLFLSASIFSSSQRVCPCSQDISSACRRGTGCRLWAPLVKMVNRHTSFCRRAPQLCCKPRGHVGVRPSPSPPWGRSAGLLRPWCDTACPPRYTNAGRRPPAGGRTASICTHHYNQGPSVKGPDFLISGILSGKFLASGQQQKVRGASADHDHDKHNGALL